MMRRNSRDYVKSWGAATIRGAATNAEFTVISQFNDKKKIKKNKKIKISSLAAKYREPPPTALYPISRYSGARYKGV